MMIICTRDEYAAIRLKTSGNTSTCIVQLYLSICVFDLRCAQRAAGFPNKHALFFLFYQNY